MSDQEYSEGEIRYSSNSASEQEFEEQPIDEQVHSQVLTSEAEMVPCSERTTPFYMTKYEKARVIGTRAVQISRNSPVLIKLDFNDVDPVRIAEMELAQRKIPFVIRRYLSDGTFEDWRVSELQIIDRF